MEPPRSLVAPLTISLGLDELTLLVEHVMDFTALACTCSGLAQYVAANRTRLTERMWPHMMYNYHCVLAGTAYLRYSS